tara:strand:- start:136 stop:414 length:279 start_codon:yes stop_codon:yes gene_type:complete
MANKEWYITGAELLKTALEDRNILEAQRFLESAGVDSGLYILFCSLPQGRQCAESGMSEAVWQAQDIRSLMQCAFMLGTYVHKSIEEVDKLW